MTEIEFETQAQILIDKTGEFEQSLHAMVNVYSGEIYLKLDMSAEVICAITVGLIGIIKNDLHGEHLAEIIRIIQNEIDSDD